jgi:hypothetical protein
LDASISLSLVHASPRFLSYHAERAAMVSRRADGDPNIYLPIAW